MSYVHATSRKDHADALAVRLAAIGIYAMYGGTKGHGFWLMRAKPGDAEADQRIRAGEGLHLLVGGGRMDAVTNDGKRSGNEFFTMFSDARGLLS